MIREFYLMILGLLSLKESLSFIVFYSKLLYKHATFCRNRSIYRCFNFQTIILLP